MDTIEYLALSDGRTVKIEWSVEYWDGAALARKLLAAGKPEGLIHGLVRVRSLAILAEKYTRSACFLRGADAALLGSALARIAAVTATMQAQDFQFED